MPSTLLDAFAGAPGGQRLLELKVVVGAPRAGRWGRRARLAAHGHSTGDHARPDRRAGPPVDVRRHAQRQPSHDRARRSRTKGAALPRRRDVRARAALAGGHGARRRDHPPRVLLRRVGGRAGLPREGHPQRGPSPARQPGGSRPDRRLASAWLRPSSATTRSISPRSGRVEAYLVRSARLLHAGPRRARRPAPRGRAVPSRSGAASSASATPSCWCHAT